MFLFASKIGWFFAQPLTLVLILLLAAFAMSVAGWRKRGLVTLGLAIVGLVLSAYTTLGYLMIGSLEGRFVRPSEMPARVDGIVVLGGGMDADINNVRHGYEFNRSGDRFTEALRLALLYPEARIAISGGVGVFVAGDDPEAAAAARFFVDFGIAEDRLILEGESRNTEENAQLTRATVDPKPGEVWLLVTSAFHMPRSVGLFRRAGFDVVPWPTDYMGNGTESASIKLDEPAENLTVTTLALREWAGLLVYYLTGKIDQMVPGPT
jgi:uncharacterized SAM-binding protein YcdF (DUF218 family)